MIKKVPVIILAIILAIICAVMAFVLSSVLKDNARLSKELSDTESQSTTLAQAQDAGSADVQVETTDGVEAAAVTEPMVNPDTVQDTLDDHNAS